jgi:hypothetical protein
MWKPHREVFTGVLGVLADHGLLQGQRIAINATTLEAKAAMRSIVLRDRWRVRLLPMRTEVTGLATIWAKLGSARSRYGETVRTLCS